MNKELSAFRFENLRERYTVKTETDNTGWSRTQVKVFDNNISNTEPIYEYERNYSMLDTFEPFRLWDKETEQWRHFALISPEYINFEVLDLDNREIIAKNPPLLVDEERAELMNSYYIENGKEPKYKVGDDISGWRFCPRSFHVPDVYDILTDRDIKTLKKDIAQNEEKEITYWNEWFENFLNRRTFGFEAGCVWGDDWSDKVQAIELSQVLQGKVSDDDRFGYFVLQGELSKIYDINYFDDDGYATLNLNTPISFKFDKDEPSKVIESDFYGTDLPNFTYEA